MGKSIPFEYEEVLHNLLRDIRLEAGLCQFDLAQKLGKHQNYVSRYEAGERCLDVLELRELCLTLNFNVAEFVTHLETLL
jgi:ribosome-binding protein aMBF1 (putative translation factor)